MKDEAYLRGLAVAMGDEELPEARIRLLAIALRIARNRRKFRNLFVAACILYLGCGSILTIFYKANTALHETNDKIVIQASELRNACDPDPADTVEPDVPTGG